MEAFSASIILFLGRAWDAITDPLIGYALSKSGRTRIGKLIPWWVSVLVNIWQSVKHFLKSDQSLHVYYIFWAYKWGLCLFFITFFYMPNVHHYVIHPLYTGLFSLCHLGSYHTSCSGIPHRTPCPLPSVSVGTSYGAVCLTPSWV